MTHPASEIRALLRRLDGEPADAIESETLECKPWDPRAKEPSTRSVREAVVALANRRGGTILLGVVDGKRTREGAIRGVGNLDANDLRRRIYDGTVPHILVEIEDLVEPEGRLLLIRVPRGMPPHTTSEGVAKIRVGKESKPLTGADLARVLFEGGQGDMSAEPVPEATLADLDPVQMRVLRDAIRTERGSRDLERCDDAELLDKLELLQDGAVRFAAILLLGKSSALARWAAQHEVIFLRFGRRGPYEARHDLKGPLLAVLDDLKRILEANLRIVGVPPDRGFQEMLFPDITWWAAREAVLNALVHRDYFLRQSVQVELHPDRLEVTSPGGFIGGITPDNVLRHPAVRRNGRLAEVLQRIGIVNRAGVGVGVIYEQLLRLGKGLPRYESDESHVRLVLPTKTHQPFARFVAEETRQGADLDRDDLILFWGMTQRGVLDRWSAARYLQLPEGEAAERLASLRRRGYLVAHGRGRGTSYRFQRRLSDLLRGRAAADDEIPLDEEAVRLRVLAVLAERGKLTNAEVRRMSGYSRTEVLRLMHGLQEEGQAVLEGRGRGAHYVPGPRHASSSKGRRGGRK